MTDLTKYTDPLWTPEGKIQITAEGLISQYWQLNPLKKKYVTDFTVYRNMNHRARRKLFWSYFSKFMDWAEGYVAWMFSEKHEFPSYSKKQPHYKKLMYLATQAKLWAIKETMAINRGEV